MFYGEEGVNLSVLNSFDDALSMQNCFRGNYDIYFTMVKSCCGIGCTYRLTKGDSKKLYR